MTMALFSSPIHCILLGEMSEPKIVKQSLIQSKHFITIMLEFTKVNGWRWMKSLCWKCDAEANADGTVWVPKFQPLNEDGASVIMSKNVFWNHQRKIQQK